MEGLHVVFSVAGTILPIVAAMHVLLSRRYAYPIWAKIIWIAASPIGLSWGILGWILAHRGNYHLADGMYHKLAAIRWFLWGVIVGFATVFAIARPYREANSEESERLRDR